MEKRGTGLNPKGESPDRDYRLYQTASVYQASIPFFNTQISSVAPYSIVPTLRAVGLGLWWDTLDKSFRTVQPYLSMWKDEASISHGLSYRSTYWAWAALKSASNKHWLLSFITIGSTPCQVFIIVMSAFFESDPGNFLHSVALDRALEPRQNLMRTQVSMAERSSGDFATQIVEHLYSNISSNWIYGATIQLSLSGSEPAWSTNGWSFTPITISNVSGVRDTIQIG
ncbi:hypothetical protein K469DRAFT_744158 [Zopfia rhizophila CBS 207.26]|uniref:Uncharacterized protein n=1 Tax=Zopfia rhizophila CBS 207.26 TaxID=1314779 RepID=A0A6A6EX96_9PEZI|nr:hypothetical protein K469DRAFT_744158 [Zopfia rhizophila CBS 207.26]